MTKMGYGHYVRVCKAILNCILFSNTKPTSRLAQWHTMETGKLVTPGQTVWGLGADWSIIGTVHMCL